MIRKVMYVSTVEEWPINMWDIVVTEYVWWKIVLARKVFYRTCHGYDSKVAKPHVCWYLTGGPTGRMEEKKFDIPNGCMWVSGKAERMLA